jgi:predicted dehydrogenase
VTTEFSDMDSDWGASFVAGVKDFAESIIEGRQASLTGEEGKAVFQFCRAVEISAKEKREVMLDEVT